VITVGGSQKGAKVRNPKKTVCTQQPGGRQWGCKRKESPMKGGVGSEWELEQGRARAKKAGGCVVVAGGSRSGGEGYQLP